MLSRYGRYYSIGQEECQTFGNENLRLRSNAFPFFYEEWQKDRALLFEPLFNFLFLVYNEHLESRKRQVS